MERLPDTRHFPQRGDHRPVPPLGLRPRVAAPVGARLVEVGLPDPLPLGDRGRDLPHGPPRSPSRPASALLELADVCRGRPPSRRAGDRRRRAALPRRRTSAASSPKARRWSSAAGKRSAARRRRASSVAARADLRGGPATPGHGRLPGHLDRASVPGVGTLPGPPHHGIGRG